MTMALPEHRLSCIFKDAPGLHRVLRELMVDDHAWISFAPLLAQGPEGLVHNLAFVNPGVSQVPPTTPQASGSPEPSVFSQAGLLVHGMEFRDTQQSRKLRSSPINACTPLCGGFLVRVTAYRIMGLSKSVMIRVISPLSEVILIITYL